MMILRSSPTSPFGRKVKIAAHHLGLIDRITITVADTSDPGDTLRTQNPLGKIPALILADGTALYDSRVILDYLDMLAGGGRIVPVGLARFPALVRQALADGVMDAGLLRVYEVRFRPEESRVQAWTDHQAGKMERSLAVLERDIGAFDPALDVGSIALACALGYLDLRFAGAWRSTHPRLVEWLEGFAAAVPSFDLTRPPA
ncbi:glutathione S-transferase [Labrys wisconsinensis]|uniref:Glutathione S-transferase n=1 Tax=Labrys wisconsinensis TaxID=425677 RepID=A0ABU0JJY9_9HYPH|nr:glutathione S-transferase [Labrys wisconsinensis]MDQ0473713.1 glutathione S-transferase [Labrys wisconsinensis]